MKKQRLTIENRILIEELVKLKYKLKHIAEIIEVDKSTISRELKKRRITGKGNYKECKLTTRFPYVCNGCDNRIKCRKKKYYYHYDKAQKHYDYILKTSRTGIDMSIDELYYWDEYFKDKIKNKNQPITHIFKNIENEFPKTLPTFYKYIHNGHFPSLNDEMLPRAYSYKPRKRTGEEPKIRVNNTIRKGRSLDNLKEYLEIHPEANIVEMDTVIGKFEDKQIINKITEEEDGVNVYIGSETEFDDDVTIIKTKYNINYNALYYPNQSYYTKRRNCIKRATNNRKNN